jgi:hypothetical protein
MNVKVCRERFVIGIARKVKYKEIILSAERSPFEQLRVHRGCQIFLGPIIPKWEKYTK